MSSVVRQNAYSALTARHFFLGSRPEAGVKNATMMTGHLREGFVAFSHREWVPMWGVLNCGAVDTLVGILEKGLLPRRQHHVLHSV